MTNERASKLERALEGLAEGDCEYWSDPAQMYRDKFVAAEQRIATLEAVLRELVHKLEMVEESHWFRNMFVVAAVHGARYEGPTWAPELTAAKAALAAQPAQEKCDKCGGSKLACECITSGHGGAAQEVPRG